MRSRRTLIVVLIALFLTLKFIHWKAYPCAIPVLCNTEAHLYSHKPINSQPLSKPVAHYPGKFLDESHYL